MTWITPHEDGSTSDIRFWVAEKCSKALRSLAAMIDESDVTMTDIDHLHHAILMNMTIWVHATGENFDPWRGTKLIRENGTRGYDVVAERLGMIRIAPDHEVFQRRANSLSKLTKALERERLKGRTEFKAALDAGDFAESNEVETLRDLIDAVVLGDLEWDAFIRDCQPSLDLLRQELDLERSHLLWADDPVTQLNTLGNAKP